MSPASATAVGAAAIARDGGVVAGGRVVDDAGKQRAREARSRSVAAAKSAASLPSTRSALRPVATPVALVVNGAPVGVAGLDAAALGADGGELEGAAALEVDGLDAGLVAGAGAAAVDGAAAVAVLLVGLAGAVGRVVGDDLGLGAEGERGVVGRVALAEQHVPAFAEAHRDGRDADREDERADDRGATGETELLHAPCDTSPATELRGCKVSVIVTRENRATSRSPGCLVGLTETGTLRSSAVRMIRVCSTVWAAG